MSQAKPFLFDRKFDEAAEEEEAVKMPSPEEIALAAAEESRKLQGQARAEGFAEGEREGFRRGEAAAKASIEAAVSQVLADLSGSLSEQLSRLSPVTREMEDRTLEVVSSLVRKLAPALLESGAWDQVRSLVISALQKSVGLPEVEIRVSPDLAPALQESLAGICSEVSYKGRVEVVADPSFVTGRVEAHWGTGGVTRDPGKVEDLILASVEEVIKARTLAAGHD